jgi:RNA polymerase sigma factor (sigma-70 family)
MFFKRLRKQKQPDDAELIRLYQSTNDNSYIGQLYERYIHLAYGVCMKYLKNEEDSKDAVMQIFEKLLQELKTHQVTNFGSWLHVIARNHCLMWLRSAKYRNEKNSIRYDVSDTMENDEQLHLIDEEDRSLEDDLVLLEKSIEKLPPEQKQCIELFYLEQNCYKDIALITGYDLNKVKSYIQNGKRNLKIYIQKENE